MEHPLARFFPDLSPAQLEALTRLEAHVRDWNARLNLVSRKDMEQFTLHHVAHSLALLHWVRFSPRSRVLDVGTGGGLPGLPLAICLPDVQFHLCDSIAKKAKAVASMAEELGLANVQVINKRAETLESKWDFVLGRAVTSLPQFIGWIRKNIRPGQASGIPNGILYWKGSLYRDELLPLGIEPRVVWPISEKLPDPYFDGKYIIHLTREQALEARLPEEPS